MMRRIAAMAVFGLLCLFLTACGESQYSYERVTIVHIYFDEETGQADYHTIVEFPDGSRRTRFGPWGKEGDEFRAIKDHNRGWASP